MKRRLPTGAGAAPSAGSGWSRLWLSMLLLAAPVFAEGPVRNIPNPFPPAIWSVQLADQDATDDHSREPGRRRPYEDSRGDKPDKRWENQEQRQRIEDRRRRFEALPQNQQQRLIQARERFLHLPPEDRERLRQRWQQMSPEDRRRWRESESHRD